MVYGTSDLGIVAGRGIAATISVFTTIACLSHLIYYQRRRYELGRIKVFSIIIILSPIWFTWWAYAMMYYSYYGFEFCI